MTQLFHSIHAHQMVRVAAATPRASVGDIDANLDAAVAMAREADARGVDCVVFPELNLTSYALDDLHLQSAQQRASDAAVVAFAERTAAWAPLLLVGAALVRNGRLYNCAVAVHRGRILGVVPKSFLPNYREYYEKRWFAPGLGLTGLTIRLGDADVPFGTDLLFAAEDLPGFVVHAEICEDYWAPTPPSTMGALAGATICCNLSASNIVIGKARERMLLAAAQSARAACAYVYSAAGPGESTTDLAWDGQGLIYELGELLTESSRFSNAAELVVADIDCERLVQERLRNGTFNDSAAAAGHPERDVRRIGFTHGARDGDTGLDRRIRRFPFVPDDPARRDEDCYEAFNIQVEALVKRLSATGSKTLVIGVSGGLDSTHALIVAAKAMDRMGRPRSDILGFTMPGFATGEATKGNAWALMRALGCIADEIDIRPAARQMLADMGHPFASGEAVYDVTFENVQAGLRTDYLFRLANQRRGIVLGTGDLSELALGWCTYGVGDQMSHYAINAGVPKTLIQFLIRWCIRTDQYDAATNTVLATILAQEISPELVPADADTGAMQSTESMIGPYALNDFFAHYVIRHGLAPSKIAFLAWHAWHDAAQGGWPEDVPADARVAYDLPTIKYWLERFLVRFFQTSQFKRSAIPNGPKVSAGGALSPRGDWRAPSDGTASVWLNELRRNVP
ncbi:NAD(+) synthase [Sphingomonas melonis TY]|jgi:NAD+ synthase (glutamine-hydrolysing)|uniref:Glutamine-dependent NAD(+) synthetase n=1 Tax=Sphingomonas melonis TY TaxID=621456 RepID=A0A175Y8D3_9SPHN|nr:MULTISPECIES: NAD(+) synthase [Sphingomonas]ATI55106.1 NAD(+) synthase [Sphingomonas melonis]KZB96519.1 NAD(+) synthase [Sphingomonas melonis TY]MBI0532826.1 NAD(+) synthase [Sphingomonas sp. TX0522]MBX8843576.1 NAD(+) synthase [Sphingomonas melonis]MBX8852980.1 NAD(+) synthase [Sphingomonas melonis]